MAASRVVDFARLRCHFSAISAMRCDRNIDTAPQCPMFAEKGGGVRACEVRGILLSSTVLSRPLTTSVSQTQLQRNADSNNTIQYLLGNQRALSRNHNLDTVSWDPLPR